MVLPPRGHLFSNEASPGGTEMCTENSAAVRQGCEGTRNEEDDEAGTGHEKREKVTSRLRSRRDAFSLRTRLFRRKSRLRVVTLRGREYQPSARGWQRGRPRDGKFSRFRLVSFLRLSVRWTPRNPRPHRSGYIYEGLGAVTRRLLCRVFH